MVKHLALSALMIGALCLMSTPAWSDKGHKGKQKDAHVAELVKAAKVTIDQAAKTASDKVPGTVVEAELEREYDKTVWEVKVLGADGHLTELHIDAETGAIIDTEVLHEKRGKKEKH